MISNLRKLLFLLILFSLAVGGPPSVKAEAGGAPGLSDRMIPGESQPLVLDDEPLWQAAHFEADPHQWANEDPSSGRAQSSVGPELLPVEPHAIIGQRGGEPSEIDAFPSLEAFRRQVANGQADRITGLWVEGVLAFKVQAGTTRLAPSARDTVSIYDWAEEHGVTAFLIHSHLGGIKLYQLKPGVHIAVIYGNGGVDWYLSRGGAWYESLTYSPEGFRGPFREWSCNDCPFDLSVEELHWRHYAGAPRLAFQTCVVVNGRNGLMIVEAFLDGSPSDNSRLDSAGIQSPFKQQIFE